LQGGLAIAEIPFVMKRRWWVATCAALVLAAVVALLPSGREETVPAFAAPRLPADWPTDPSHDQEFRTLALRHAKVWRPPHARADLVANPADPSGALSEPVVRCRFLSKRAHGTSPKFDCVLPDGEVVKVKYGTDEVHAELAASRLLTALGFGADRMFLVPRIRCYGCPRFPFYVTWLLDHLHARAFAARHLADDRYTDFEWAAVERRFEGASIEAHDAKGWAWWELDQIDPAIGASRAELDAFRIIAMFLAHWDNKASNQRLVCFDAPPGALEGPGRPPPCQRSFAIIQDLGATFGPRKVDLPQWKATPIWADARSCAISMRQLPYDGGTFPDVRITEGGRQLIAHQLAALDDHQIVSMFSTLRFAEFGADASAWAQVFREKVRQITDAGPCPS
jgi:hypothetical protein